MNGAWKCIMVMPNLLLQKPVANSKAKDYKNALEGRMLVLWKNGEFLSLLKEAETIQKESRAHTQAWKWKLF